MNHERKSKLETKDDSTLVLRESNILINFRFFILITFLFNTF